MTSELKRYTCSETSGGEMLVDQSGEYVRYSDVAAYTQAAIAAAMMGAVKPLEWEDCSSRHRVQLDAVTQFGTYFVQQFFFPETGFIVYLGGETKIGGMYSSEDQAKAAAEADYQARILSALNIPADAMAALAAMLAEAEKRGWDRGLEDAAKLIETTAYTSNGDTRSLQPAPKVLAGADTHHATIAAAIRAMKGGAE